MSASQAVRCDMKFEVCSNNGLVPDTRPKPITTNMSVARNAANLAGYILTFGASPCPVVGDGIPTVLTSASACLVGRQGAMAVRLSL